MPDYEPIGTASTPRETNGGRSEARAEERRGAAEADTLGRLFRELSEESAAFVQAEVELVRRESAEKLEIAQRGAIQLAAGGVVLALGLWALTAALIWGLATEIAVWAAALIVGLVILAIGGVCIALAKRNMGRKRLEPERTMRSLRATRSMAEEHIR